MSMRLIRAPTKCEESRKHGCGRVAGQHKTHHATLGVPILPSSWSNGRLRSDHRESHAGRQPGSRTVLDDTCEYDAWRPCRRFVRSLRTFEFRYLICNSGPDRQKCVWTYSFSVREVHVSCPKQRSSPYLHGQYLFAVFRQSRLANLCAP